MATRIKVVDGAIATDSAGNPVDALPVRDDGDNTNELGQPITPLQVVEDETGMPVRFVDDKVVLNSAGQPVASLPVEGVTSSPENEAPPSFTGTMTAGQTLTYVPGEWSGDPEISVQWLADGVAIVGETGNTLDTTGLGGQLISVGESADYGDDGIFTASSATRYLFVNDAARVLVARITAEPDDYWKAAYDGVFSVSGFATALAKLDQFAMFSGPDQQASLLDWAHASRTLTANGGLTFTPAEGVHNDAVSGFIGSGVLHNAGTHLTQNSASLGVYVKAASNSVDLNHAIGINTATDRFRLAAGSATDSASTRVNDASTLAGGNGNDATGMFVGRRSASNAKELRRNGVDLVADATTASAGLQAAEILYFRNSSGTYAHSSLVLSAGWFGAFIDDTDEAAIKTGVETFNMLATPRNFLIVFSGQSLANRQFLDNDSLGSPGGSGDGTPGSNVIARLFRPELQAALDAQYNDGRPNVLTIINTSVSGSYLTPAPGENYWWDPTTDQPGLYAQNHNDDVEAAISDLGGSANIFAAVEVWIHGNASIGLTQSEYVDAFCDTDYDGALAAYMRQALGAGAKIIISPVGRDRSNSDANTKAIRDAHGEIAANLANTLLGAETCDVVRIDDFDPHPVSFGVSADGFDRLSEFNWRAVASAFGCTAVEWEGPTVASAAIVDGTHTDITLVHAGGTDFTPTSAIEGFKVYDDGAARAVSAAARTDATHIRLTHAAVSGTRTVQFEPTQGALNRANMVRDDFAGIAMPLRFSPLLTAT